jgi:hypothetical protein
MAYITHLASIAEGDVDEFRLNATLQLHPSLVCGASHLLSYWVTVQPLGQLLNEAIDGGEVLHRELWHPLRPPMFHRPPKVQSLSDRVGAAWEAAISEVPQDDGGWYAIEIGKLLQLYRHAASAGECVVTALALPADEERAQRVRIPWEPWKAPANPGNRPWWRRIW